MSTNYDHVPCVEEVGPPREYPTISVYAAQEALDSHAALRQGRPPVFYEVCPLERPGPGAPDRRPFLGIWFYADRQHSTSYIFPRQADAQRFADHCDSLGQPAAVAIWQPHPGPRPASAIVYRTDTAIA